jgi:hypothetical protein
VSALSSRALLSSPTTSAAVNHLNAYIKSGVVPVSIRDGGGFSNVTLFVDTLLELYASRPNALAQFVTHDGGAAVARVDPSRTAFVHRNALVILELKCVWTDEEGDAMGAACSRWTRTWESTLAPFFQGAYVNYIDRALPDWQDAYYGENYARLAAIKRSADPHNFFRFAQSIGSDLHGHW